MYVLSSLGESFAIVKNNNVTMSIEKAITEKFSLTDVSLVLGKKFRLPNLEESIYIDYTGTDEDGFKITGMY
jgi:hypothetical protein